MVCPRWTNTRTQVVGLGDTVELLSHVVAREPSYGRVYDVSAPDTVTYRETLAITARALGKRRRFVGSPFLSPGLSRLWVSLVTGAPRALVAPLVQSLRHELIARESTLAQEAGLAPTSTERAIDLAIASDVRSTPHAFRGPRSPDRQRFVRSVQRMRLPEGWTAERAALEYTQWLPRFLRFLLRVRLRSERSFSFVFAPLGITLLTLTHSDARSSLDRQLFYVTGGALATKGGNPRFELRQILGGRTLLTVVHDYEPRLPWLLYIFTQARVHSWLMGRFAAHLARIPAGPPVIERAPEAAPS